MRFGEILLPLHYHKRYAHAPHTIMMKKRDSHRHAPRRQPGDVKPKKALGQHFLTDESVAQRIASTLDPWHGLPVLEVGPGMGVLTTASAGSCINSCSWLGVDPSSTLTTDSLLFGTEVEECCVRVLSAALLRDCRNAEVSSKGGVDNVPGCPSSFFTQSNSTGM